MLIFPNSEGEPPRELVKSTPVGRKVSDNELDWQALAAPSASGPTVDIERSEGIRYKLSPERLSPKLTSGASGSGDMPPSDSQRWTSFFASPHFAVITATVVVLLCGAGMYAKMDGKVDSVRIELKGDIQNLAQRTDARFDQVQARFDSLQSKMDADNRELRTLILNQQRPQQQH